MQTTVLRHSKAVTIHYSSLIPIQHLRLSSDNVHDFFLASVIGLHDNDYATISAPLFRLAIVCAVKVLLTQHVAQVIELLDPLASVIVGVLKILVGRAVGVDEDEGAVLFDGGLHKSCVSGTISLEVSQWCTHELQLTLAVLSLGLLVIRHCNFC